MSKKTYLVRYYFDKFVDVDVEAEGLEEALDGAELPWFDWNDGHDTTEVDRVAKQMDEGAYSVRIQFSKWVDVEVQAENEQQAWHEAHCPAPDWFDEHDTSCVDFTVEEVDA